MKFYEKYRKVVECNNSLVCVGLDTDPKLIPDFLNQEPDPIFAFNQQIIDATCDLVNAYKLNSAFYEAGGSRGFETLKKTRNYIPSPIPVILDGKRNDIGNSSKMYARMAFEQFGFDGITVNPYLGGDSIKPFLDYKDKGIFVLCLTSNPGALDFQMHGDPPLYIRVAESVNNWNTNRNCGLVVGATKSELLKKVREVAPDLILLIPGVGAQGGKAEDVVKYGGENLIINSSRAIIYASGDSDFAQKAREATIILRDNINRFL
ncbi:orotidine-5'-phosphate decarboxylase [candidate division WOR-3 bacterium]|nr:orotidine-5'-phosphate decarboxylase [candidate division WOR-3 bacterium]